MDWKIVLTILLSFMLVFSVFAGCTQQKDETVENVRKMVDALPTVEQFQAMDADAQLEAYNAAQAAYDAYMALSDGQKQRLEGQLQIMEELFAYFNTQIMPLG